MSTVMSVVETLHQYVNKFNSIGGYILIAVLLPVGFYLSIRFRFLQLRHIRHTIDVILGKFDDPNDPGDVSHFQALTTALSATVGVGNIAGVAIAVKTGGPGAVFWMWLVALFGMMTKFAECSLGLKYREILPDGTSSGGPMYYIREAFGRYSPGLGKFLGGFFAIAFVFMAVDLGNLIQSNAVAATLEKSYDVPRLYSGIILAVMLFIVIIGGVKRIGDVTSKLMPFMSALYVISAGLIIVLNIPEVPGLLGKIVSDAFTGSAAVGGFAGSAFALALRMGVSRGLFSNEAGLGSAPIAHAAAKTKEPIREGLVASVGPFIDTIIICTMTALVLLITNVWHDAPSGLEGAPLTVLGFERGLAPIGLGVMASHIVNVGIVLFAFSTIISWSYYGERCVTYLFGTKPVMPYRIFQCFATVFGAIFTVKFVWALGDMFMVFTTVPNLIAVLLLLGVLSFETKSYFERMKEKMGRDV